MSRSSAEAARGAVEPVAALAALLAVGAALALYAGALADAGAGDRDRDRNPAEPTLDRVETRLVVGGVARPDRLTAARAAGPDGYRVAVTLRADGQRWRTGPRPPGDADVATRAMSVRVAPGRVRSGRLRVEVW